jgi:hypothetical protein
MKIKFNQKVAGPWGVNKPGDFREIEDAVPGDEEPLPRPGETPEAFKKRRERHTFHSLAQKLLTKVPDDTPPKKDETPEAYATRRKNLIPKFAEKAD